MLGLDKPKLLGFTLMELMVVTVIVGILAAIGIPRMRGYLATARVQEAKPYMMAIAARERIYFNETGNYLAAISEQVIENTLGVELGDAGNFCFMVYCATACTGTNFGGPIAAVEAGDPPIQFEIWAVLRENDTPGETISSYLGSSCTTTADKVDSSGWVANGIGEFAGEGRVLVLRYPAPPNRTDIATGLGNTSAYHDWTEGFSASDALIP